MATAYQEMGVRLEFNELSAFLQDVGWLNGRKTILRRANVVSVRGRASWIYEAFDG
jgi:hypothetical protein